MSQSETIDTRLRRAAESLTPRERRLAAHLMRDYPAAALGSITALARAAGVSSPTVLRLAQKLGFRGYPEFQAQIHAEVQERLASPLAKRARAAGPQGHALARHVEAVGANLAATLAQVDTGVFDVCAAALADPGRRVWITGGRITQGVALLMAAQLRPLRPGVALLPDRPGDWAGALVDLVPGDLVVIFDIRRYDPLLAHLAETVAARGAEVVLFTDGWLSPAAAHARHRFAAAVEAPSVWDSTAAILVLVEALIAAVQPHLWDQAAPRLAALDDWHEGLRPPGRR